MDRQKENHRIYWLSWVPTYRDNVFETFRNHGVAIPVCETFRMFWGEIDEKRPFEGLALKCLKNPFVGPVSRRIEGIDQLAREYGMNSAVLFETPACRHSNTAHLIIKDALSRVGLPLLLLDMDISDTRSYHPEHIKTRIEAFVELMDSSRTGHEHYRSA